MKIFNDLLEKAAKHVGKVPSYERPEGTFTDPRTNEYHIAEIFDHVSHSQFTFPIVISKAEGAYLWDVTGKKYLDWLASYSCANQGHHHPKILQALINQAQKLPLNTISVQHDVLGSAAKHLTKVFGYDKILFMNSGAEAVDTAMLTARRWGYQVKKVSKGKATILFPSNNYWGMISSGRAGTDNSSMKGNCEPLGTDALHFEFVGYDDVEALEKKLKHNSNICAFIFEAVQGVAGNIQPQPGYYSRVRELCTKYNVLMIADEVQAGLGRAGKLITTEWEGVKPDIITIGKSLGGDYLPVSAVLANNNIMNLWSPGSHTSTYACNTLACAVAVAAVDVLIDEKLIENSEKLGKAIDEEFRSYDYDFIIKKSSGRGLFCSLQFKDFLTCTMVCMYMLEHGVLTYPQPGAFLKIQPPLCITETELRDSLKILKDALEEYKSKGKIGLAVDIVKEKLETTDS